MTDASAVTTSSTATTTIGAKAVPGREPLLAVNDLRVEFAARRVVHAVRGLSYTIAPGETLGLVGESGSGKSVSALALLGLLPKRVGRITAGSVRFEGRELVGLSEQALRRVRGARIGMIFQDPIRRPHGLGIEPKGSRRTVGWITRLRASGPSPSSIWSGSRPPASASTTTPISSAAGCGSGR